MYQSQFHLHSRPFAAAPNPEHYYPAASAEDARETIAMNIQRASGTTILMGAVGTGKTLLCQLISNHFTGELPVCMLPGERLTSREMLLQAILRRLEIPFRHQNDSELRITLMDHVMGQSCPNGILLVIDEADRLPLTLLEEIRVITNLVKDGQPRVRLLMAGTSRLEERIAHPKLESLNQRIVGRLHLNSFSREETADYVRARLTTSGGDAEGIFNDDALQTVYLATQGIPRLINQICDHALLMASDQRLTQLDGAIIEDAWSDLHQLPMPASLESTRSHSTTPSSNDAVVEFAALDDDDSESYVEDQDDEQSVEKETVGELAEDSTDTSSIEENTQLETDSLLKESTDEVITLSVVVDDSESSDANEATDLTSIYTEPLDERGSPFADEHEQQNEVSISVDNLFEGHAFQSWSDAGSFDLANQDDEVAESDPVNEPTDVDFATDLHDQTAKAFYDEDEAEDEVSQQDAIIVAFDRGSESVVPTPHIPLSRTGNITQDLEFTIDQATNPFDEEFEEEEIVIQQFVCPSRLARTAHSDVSSAYSRRLGSQLAAAHPGLRMLEADDEPRPQADTDKTVTLSQFQPLSAYNQDDYLVREDASFIAGGSIDVADELDDVRSVEFGHDVDDDAEDFDPADDPVMPDVAMASITPQVSIPANFDAEQNTSDIAEEVARGQQSDIDLPTEAMQLRVHTDGISTPTNMEEFRQPAKPKEKVFRSLFSKLRRA